ncbi:hypothetical protein ACLMJK_000400 [Lecanora helva]
MESDSLRLPPLAPIPPANVQKNFVPEEWALCIDSWLILTREILMLPTKHFVLTLSKDETLPQFLVSFVKNPPSTPNQKAAALRKISFLLVHRIFEIASSTPSLLLDWNFWVDISVVYAGSKALRKMLSNQWIKAQLDEDASMRRYKSTLIRALEVSHLNLELEELLPKTLALLRSCYPYGQFLMLGSDLVDALTSAYEKKPRSQKKIVTILYFSLTSLLEPARPRVATLLDHLYSLNSSVSHHDSLLKSLVGTTPLLQKLRSSISGSESGRASSLIDLLKGFEMTPDGRPKKHIRRKIDKGKAKDRDGYGHGSMNDIPIFKLSLIFQIQDLFPYLGTGFIAKLLDEYKDDPEQVTAHLLDDSLPTHLKRLDHSETLPQTPDDNTHDLVPDLAPHSTPPLPPTRRNIHDDDDFDRLAIDTSKVRLGKDRTKTADSLLASERPSNQKAAILSALAAFDSDDDERDDTYDAEDVGGTVDTTNEENAGDMKQDANEEALSNAYNISPELFDRDAQTRRSQARAGLKSETGMTDEAIEGWGIMVARDPRRLDRLKRKFEMGGGIQQRALGSTAWKGDSGTEDSDAAGASRGWRGGRARARGAGRGRGRGGDVSGPTDDRGTQMARQRKDANKGSRANHNRRDQRAKKMARGGLPG